MGQYGRTNPTTPPRVNSERGDFKEFLTLIEDKGKDNFCNMTRNHGNSFWQTQAKPGAALKTQLSFSDQFIRSVSHRQKFSNMAEWVELHRSGSVIKMDGWLTVHTKNVHITIYVTAFTNKLYGAQWSPDQMSVC